MPNEPFPTWCSGCGRQWRTDMARCPNCGSIGIVNIIDAITTLLMDLKSCEGRWHYRYL